MNLLANKRIQFILGSLELGGSEKQAIQLANYLKNDLKSKVHFMAFSNPGRAATLCDQYNIPWEIIDNPLRQTDSMTLKKNLIKYILAIRAHKPNILMPYTTVPNVATGLVWKWTGADSCIWNQRDLGIESIDMDLSMKAVKRTQFFLSNSQGGKEYLVNHFHIDPKKIKVIHNGLVLPSQMIDPEKSGNKSNSELIGCMIANLSQHKDHDTLIHAWRIVVEYYNNREMKPTLLLAGRFDNQEPKLRQLVNELKLDDHVKFLGQIEDVNSLLENVDLGLFSSKSEGLPNGVMECMAMGLPVVATDIPGIRELVGIEGSRFLAPQQDYQKFAELTIEFFENPQLRQEIGENNLQRIKNEYSNEKLFKETTIILKESLS